MSEKKTDSEGRAPEQMLRRWDPKTWVALAVVGAVVGVTVGWFSGELTGFYFDIGSVALSGF